MMKRILILLLLIPAGMLAQKKKKLSLEEQVAIAKQQEKEAMQQQYPVQALLQTGAALPAFHVLTSESTLFFDSSLVAGQPTLLVFFNPGCDHCLDFLKQLKTYMNLLNNPNILFVTGENLWGDLKEFIRLGNIIPADRIIVASDHSGISKTLFAGKGIPQVMIYDNKRILQKILYQDISKDSMLYYLNR